MFSDNSTTGTAISQSIASNPGPIKKLVAAAEGITPDQVKYSTPQGRGAGSFISPFTTHPVLCRALGPEESESVSVQVRTIKSHSYRTNTQHHSILFVWRNKEGDQVSAVAFPGHRFQQLLEDPNFHLTEKSGKYHFLVSAGWEEQCNKAGVPYLTAQTSTSY